MKLYLADVKPDMTQAWRTQFANLADVEIYDGSIFDLKADAIVSPANSFGFMDGGIDLLLSEFLGWHVEKRLQERLRSHYRGELLVGQAAIVPTDHARFPYLISAPTMRVPTELGANSVNAYLAMRAVLQLIQLDALDDGTPIKDVIHSLAVPGLGTGVGRVPADICAYQMHRAYLDIVGGELKFPATLWVAHGEQNWMMRSPKKKA
ncbi:MAG: macro domain-containing protein [Phototrophicaceae bacterium]|jgi:O-acetyl-ADP-ribose deacetylase (regulator of RNase III)